MPWLKIPLKLDLRKQKCTKRLSQLQMHFENKKGSRFGSLANTQCIMGFSGGGGGIIQKYSYLLQNNML